MAQIDTKTGERLLALRARVVANFANGNWEELGLLTGSTALITKHERLLRSLPRLPTMRFRRRCGCRLRVIGLGARLAKIPLVGLPARLTRHRAAPHGPRARQRRQYCVIVVLMKDRRSEAMYRDFIESAGR